MSELLPQQKPGDIPAEYAEELAKLQRREMMAQLLMRLGQMPAGQMVGNRFVAPSPLATIAGAIVRGLGMRDLAQLPTERASVLKRMQAAEQTELGRIASLLTPQKVQLDPRQAEGGAEYHIRPADPLAAEREAFASRFQNIRKFGEQLRTQRANLFSVMAPRATPESVIASGGDPTKLVPTPPERYTDVQPIAGTEKLPGGPIYGQFEVNTNKVRSLTGSPSVNTNISLERPNVAALAKEHERLAAARQQYADKASTLPAVAEALHLLKSGKLYTGSLAEKQSAIMKLSRFVPGAQVDPRAAGTELYNSFIVPLVGNMVKLFGAGTAISNADLEFAKKAAALADRDPRMAEVALKHLIRSWVRDVSDYNTQVKQLEAVASEIPGLGSAAKLYGNMFVPFSFNAAGLDEDVFDPSKPLTDSFIEQAKPLEPRRRRW